MQYPQIDQLNCNTCTEKSIKLHYPEFHKFILNNYPNDLIWGEKLYWFYNHLTDYPKCYCGNKTGFINFKKGYKQFCSTKCSNNNPNKKEKTKQTCRLLYGGDAPAISKEIKNKISQTNLERYGVDNPMKVKEIQEKSKQTNLERYGGCGNQSNTLKQKQKQTMKVKYGVENAMMCDSIIQIRKNNSLIKYGYPQPPSSIEIRNKIRNSRRKFEINHKDFLIGYTKSGMWICKCPHPECNKCTEKQYIIPPLIREGREKDKIELCTILKPVSLDFTKGSYPEQFIRNILDKYKIPHKTNIRLVIKPKELDIYIPSKNIAIECNGVFTHSNKRKLKSYHINKSKACNDKNIKLIHIWEDWIKNKPEIVESILLNKLGLINNSIYARKCIIKEIDSKTCNEFLDKNHIQGRSAASVRLGLYYNDELVSLMTFSPPRINMGGKNHKQQWELVRFCNKLNTRVVGGASKLLKYFIKIYHPTSIVSFSMNDISDGNLYKQLGFKTEGIVTHSYWYIEPGTLKRYHRSSFTKQQIVKRGWKDKVDNTWTEVEAMEEQGYFKIYDSGQMKWVLECK